MANKPRLILRSAGIKTSAFPDLWHPKEHDLLIDCRVVKDPSHYTQGGQKMWDWLLDQCPYQLRKILCHVLNGIDMIPERRREKDDPYKDPFKILFFCAHGMHRSVSVKQIMGRWLREAGFEVTIE